MSANWFKSELSEYEQAVAMLSLGVLAWYLWGVVSDWHELEGLYKYVAFFYYVLIVLPLSVNEFLWDYMRWFTGHDNLNFVLAVITCGFYSCVVMGMLLNLALLIDGWLGRGVAKAIFFMPLFLLIPWTVLVWLFS